ncbi:SagB/ThcOx family dehydrogenase [Metabacillus sediminilitoris]|uniref:SagB/ThcOx family dehydrogenase n=2 Tax=Metabacillus sediminilitoris TaxID=2567941 RepID=A0A4S4C4C5_9BACI|nr:SagB family peptide dehydrogenase [Metabacillus sediminilitoris]QGQ45305.1 SagB/ThcOx family dehydrogenase [Metabacillus sediminilitoris]THF82398.1 SagB/ThcOx family dehydrogenase [Metabacillus sediminilitoris]
MGLDTFLHNLHFDIDKVSPPDWEVDWDDAPLPYKLYRGLPVFPLSLEVPLSLEEWEGPAMPNLRKIGHFLWYVFGLTQFSQTAFTSTEEVPELMQSSRRFVPSGGALYPSELYVYLKIEDLPFGVYHYDVAHHRLVLLREGNFDSYIASALGNRCELSSSFGAAFVSTMFWKNYYKYNNFAYRLQGLDAGVLIGQLLEVAKRFGFASGVYFQFLDKAINHLLGLSQEEESVYAVIPLTVEPTRWYPNGGGENEHISAAELSRELNVIQNHHFVRSQIVKKFPMLNKMNEASMLESTRSFQPIKGRESRHNDSQLIALPYVNRLSYDLASACRERFSPDMDFVLGKVTQSQLAVLLQEVTSAFMYRNDLDEEYEKSRVSLYGCFYHVEGIPDGAYQYDSAEHALRQIQPGDHRLPLQYGMTIGNVNLLQVPLCFHVAGDKDYFKSELGYRGYRIQQMEAGMLVQRLLLVSSALGMGGHPLLGFDAKLCDEIYQMDSLGKTSLIQIPIGPYRNRPWLQGSLLS